MNRLTNEQRLQIIELYYQNACCVRKVHRALLPFYGQFNRPTEAAIRALVTKFRTKFTLLDIKPPTRLRRVRTEENIAAVSASVNDDHQLSIRRRSQHLGLCYSTTYKILQKDLGLGRPRSDDYVSNSDSGEPRDENGPERSKKQKSAGERKKGAGRKRKSAQDNYDSDSDGDARPKEKRQKKKAKEVSAKQRLKIYINSGRNTNRGRKRIESGGDSDDSKSNNLL